MTPTQAQIEAAAKATFDYDKRNSKTSAAWKTAKLYYEAGARYALTAAAQIGDAAEQEARGECFDMGWEKAVERCAQVAEQAQKPHWTVDGRNIVEAIAAAIRKLKEVEK